MGSPRIFGGFVFSKRGASFLSFILSLVIVVLGAKGDWGTLPRNSISLGLKGSQVSSQTFGNWITFAKQFESLLAGHRDRMIPRFSLFQASWHFPSAQQFWPWLEHVPPIPLSPLELGVGVGPWLLALFAAAERCCRLSSSCCFCCCCCCSNCCCLATATAARYLECCSHCFWWYRSHVDWGGVICVMWVTGTWTTWGTPFLGRPCQNEGLPVVEVEEVAM